jgi:hypothetical protein
MAEAARRLDRPSSSPLAPVRYRPALYSDYLQARPMIAPDRFPNLRWAGRQLARLTVIGAVIAFLAVFLWSRR